MRQSVRGRSCAVGLLICGLLGTGCGSRRDHAAFVAADRLARTPVVASPAGQVGNAGPERPVAGDGSAVTAPGTGATAPTTAPSAGPQRTTPSASGAAGSGGGAPSGRTSTAPTGPTGAAGQGAGGGAAAAPKTPLRLGQVSSLSGPIGSNLSVPSLKATQAWVASINARGGLNGHSVELVVADDGNDPSRNRALVQQLVERNKVVAFLHNSSPLSGGASVQYIQEHQVPVIGMEGGSPWANENTMYFPQTPNQGFLGFTYAGATAQVALAEGKTKVAVITCVEASACQAAANPDAFRGAGMTVVYEARVSLAQPDFTAQCLGARNAGAEVVFIALDSGSVMRVADNCSNVGLKPLYGWVSNAVNDDETGKTNLDRGVVGLPAAPWNLQTLPAIAEMRSAMATYSPGTPVVAPTTLGWISAKLLEAAGRALPEPPTSPAILEGLWGVKDNDLGGLTYPLTFTKGAPNNAASMKACWWIVRIQGGKWTIPDGGERHCRA